MQILASALIASPVFLFVVAFLMRALANGAQATMPVISYVGFAIAAVEVLTLVSDGFEGGWTRWGITPNRVAAARRRGAARDASPEATPYSQDLFLCGAFQTRLVVLLAVVEGTAFLQGIAYIIEGHLFSLAVGLVLLLIMVILFPTRSKLESWMAHMKQMMLDRAGPESLMRPPW
jgi:hypothetical protein